VGAAFLFRTAEILSCGTGFASPTICPHGNDSPCRARGQPSVDIKLLTKARIASWGDLCLKPLTGLLGSKVRQSLFAASRKRCGTSCAGHVLEIAKCISVRVDFAAECQDFATPRHAALSLP
jgi:hypothetical protein